MANKLGHKTLYPNAQERIDIEIGRAWRDLKLLEMRCYMDTNNKGLNNKDRPLKQTLNHLSNTLCYCCDSILNTFNDDNNFELNDNNLRLFTYKDKTFNVCLKCYRNLNIDNNMNLYIEKLRKYNKIIEYDIDVDYICD